MVISLKYRCKADVSVTETLYIYYVYILFSLIYKTKDSIITIKTEEFELVGLVRMDLKHESDVRNSLKIRSLISTEGRRK